jgi:hypothetical protein
MIELLILAIFSYSLGHELSPPSPEALRASPALRVCLWAPEAGKYGFPSGFT